MAAPFGPAHVEPVAHLAFAVRRTDATLTFEIAPLHVPEGVRGPVYSGICDPDMPAVLRRLADVIAAQFAVTA